MRHGPGPGTDAASLLDTLFWLVRYAGWVLQQPLDHTGYTVRCVLGVLLVGSWIHIGCTLPYVHVHVNGYGANCLIIYRGKTRGAFSVNPACKQRRRTHAVSQTWKRRFTHRLCGGPTQTCVSVPVQ